MSKSRGSKANSGSGWSPALSVGWLPTFLLVAGVVAAWSWAQPIQHEVTAPVEQVVTYNFGYTAEVPDDTEVYEGDALGFGDPVYLKVLDEIHVTVTVNLDMPSAVLRDAALTTKVLVSSDAGWSRELSDTGDVPFEGTMALVTVPVDFAEATSVAAELAEASGVEGQVSVTVVASARVDVITPNAVGASRSTNVSLGSLAFEVDEMVAALEGHGQLSPVDVVEAIEAGEVVASDATAVRSSLQDLAEQTTSTEVTTLRVVPETVSIGKWDLEIERLRLVAAGLLALLVLIALYDLIVLAVARRRGEAAFLNARYGAGLMNLRHVPESVVHEAVFVSNFETLGAIAADAEADILYHPGPDRERYFVFDGPRVFAYEAVPRGGEAGDSDERGATTEEMTT